MSAAQEKPKARVVRVIARLNVGGPARHVVWLTAELPAVGYESVLVTGTIPPGEDDMSYFAAERGVEPFVIPEMSREISPRDVVAVWKLYRLLRRLRPQIVHTHTAKAGTVGRLAGLLYRWFTFGALVGRPRDCRFVHTYHGHVFHSYYGKLKTRFFLGVEKALARVATDRIVVISEQQQREIHEEFGVGRAGQVVTIPLGLDLGLYDGWAARRNVVRAELGIGADEILVGIVGRLTEIKNHRMFLDAAARLRDTPARVRFVVVGDGHLRQTLEEQARQLNLDGRVVFLGLRNDPENFYPALDIVALTSLNEGTPLTLIEAMANARPVVATAVGGVVDLLGDEGDGLGSTGDAAYSLRERGISVRPDDREGFALALRLMITDEKGRRLWGEQGLAFVREKYSKERLLADLAGLYDQLLSSQPVPPTGEDARRARSEPGPRI